MELENEINSYSNMSSWHNRYKIINPGDRWRCIRCGSCCSMDFEDKWIDFIVRIDATKNSGEKCPNLKIFNNRYICGIYPARPNACRAFPFTLRKNEKGKYVLVIHNKCKGYGKGRIINIKRKIMNCVRISNREFHRRIRIDFSDFERENSVSIIK